MGNYLNLRRVYPGQYPIITRGSLWFSLVDICKHIQDIAFAREISSSAFQPGRTPMVDDPQRLALPLCFEIDMSPKGVRKHRPQSSSSQSWLCISVSPLKTRTRDRMEASVALRVRTRRATTPQRRIRTLSGRQVPVGVMSAGSDAWHHSALSRCRTHISFLAAGVGHPAYPAADHFLPLPPSCARHCVELALSASVGAVRAVGCTCSMVQDQSATSSALRSCWRRYVVSLWSWEGGG